MYLGEIANFLALATFSVSIYLFFADDLRRWAFFGFRPTAVMLLVDPKSNKCLLVKKGPNTFWYFPQGTIYGPDLNSTVKETVARELGLSDLDYKFIKTVFLGVVRKDDRRKYSQKHSSGAVSFLPFQGKSYLGCLIFVNLAKKLAIKKGYDIKETRVVTLAQALKIIDPQKAALLRRSSVFLDLSYGP